MPRGKNGATDMDITVPTTAALPGNPAPRKASTMGGHSWPCTTSISRRLTKSLMMRIAFGDGRPRCDGSSTCSRANFFTRSTSGAGFGQHHNLVSSVADRPSQLNSVEL